MMGRKKKKGVKKMKEISSVSIAEIESSSTTAELQPQVIRKRGRPRKYQEFGDSSTTDDSKKAKAVEETEEESEERGDFKEKKLEEIKEELVGLSEDKLQSSKEIEQPRRSSARRKSKPRKSS